MKLEIIYKLLFQICKDYLKEKEKHPLHEVFSISICQQLLEKDNVFFKKKLLYI